MRQEQLAKLTYCRGGCGNNFHIACLKVWFEDRKSTHQPLTCPMCRLDKGPGALEALEQEEQQEINRFITHHGTEC